MRVTMRLFLGGLEKGFKLFWSLLEKINGGNNQETL